MTTKKELKSKYKPYPTYYAIALEGFNLGLKIGKSENMTKEFINLKKEVLELRNYKKNMEETLHDPEKLANLIGGI